MSWRLLPDTRIGDLSLTEQVYANMRDIADGKTTAEECLKVVADWVRKDIETMQRNAQQMRAALGLAQTQIAARAEGVWQTAPGGPKKAAFKRIWSGHEFDDAEIEKLPAGETISFQATAKTGKPYTASGSLGIGEFKGRKFVGFQLEVPDKPTSWSGRTFTPAEVDALLAGQQLESTDFVSSRTGKTFGCKVSWDARTKKIVPDFGSGDEPPLSWSGRTFSDDERKQLAAGKSLKLDGFVSRNSGKTYGATVAWKEEGGRKKIVPSSG